MHNDLPIGSVIDGYRVLALIGTGGFGSVYRVATPDGRSAALKLMGAHLAGMPEFVARLLREARVLGMVRHPNVVEVYDAGTGPDGRPYLVMEHLTGQDLESYIDNQGRLEIDEILRFLEPLCDALAVAHDKGVVHRDIKASNVFLDESTGHLRVVLLDFGLARLADAVAPGLTSPQHAIGTPTSMTPEQILGRPVDARTDVYLLGILTYHMLTGLLPFDGPNPAAVCRLQLDAPRPRPSDRAPTTSAIDDVVMRAMNRDPAGRFPGAREFLAALRNAAGKTNENAATGEVPGVAIYLNLRLPEDADADAALLEEMQQTLAQASEHLLGRGFLPAMETGAGALYVQPIPEDASAGADARSSAVSVALDLERILARPDARAQVEICLHAGRVEMTCGFSGELVDLGTWVPEGPIIGVVGTRELFTGLSLPCAPVPGAPQLLRAIGVQVQREPAQAARAERIVQLSGFLANAVEELQAPLTSITNDLTAVLDRAAIGQPLSDQGRRALEGAIAGAKRLAAMAADLPRLAQVEDGRAEEILVSELVDSALALAHTDLVTKAEVQVCCEPGCRVYGSRARLTRLLVDLLVDAGRAIEGWGTVDLSVEHAGPRVRISIAADTATESESTDTGPVGMLSSLRVPREIIAAYGGHLEVAARPGAGARFMIDLPAA